jgi:methylmalonyl-CoA/ethylmalonyl-CoA epimerase
MPLIFPGSRDCDQKEYLMTPVKAINHIGIAVRSIDAQRAFYEGTLGAVFEGVEVVPDQKVRVGFFRIGDVRLELLEPTEPASTVAAFLEKRGEGLHHVAFSVDGIEDRIAELKQSGVRLIDETPRPGAHHMRIAFLHPKSTFGVLSELCEPAGEPAADRP